MLDPDDVWCFRIAVICPFDVAGNHVLRTLQPLETDDRYRGGLDLIRVDTTLRERVIDLVARHCRLDLFHSRVRE